MSFLSRILVLAVISLPYPALALEPVRVISTGPGAGHYLTWRGAPILLIGDSVTQGWMELGTNFNQTAYVDALAARGINVLMIWSYIGTSSSNQTSDARIGYNAPEIWPWAGSPDASSFNLTQFNQAYFDRLKSLVSYAESKGIVVLITVHDGWTKGRFDDHPFNSSRGNGPLTSASQYVELHDASAEMPTTFNSSWTRQQKNQYFQERFCAKLITELEPYSNVIYEMFNEGEWYNTTQRNLHEQHFLAFFRARTQKLLLSNTDHIAGDNPHQDAKVDVIALHGPWSGLYDTYAGGFNTTPAKPYFQSEPVPGFTGANVSLDEMRRGMWEIAMGGGGRVYQNDTSFGWDPNADVVSYQTTRDQVYDQIGYAARFFNNYGIRFEAMRPQPGLASNGSCLAQLGVEYLVYAPSGGTVTLDLSAAAGRAMEAIWYNPRTGAFGTVNQFTGGSSAQMFTAPFSGDAVLRVVESGSTADAVPPAPITDLRR